MYGDRSGSVIQSPCKLLGEFPLIRPREQRAEVARELAVRSVCRLKGGSARLAAGRQLDAIGRKPVLE